MVPEKSPVKLNAIIGSFENKRNQNKQQQNEKIQVLMLQSAMV